MPNVFEQIQSFFSPSPAVPAAPHEAGMPKPDATAPASATDFSKLFAPQENPTPQLDDPIFDHSPADLTLAVDKFDFTDSPEFDSLASAALQGDTKALKNLINSAVKAGFSQSTQVGLNLAERAAIEAASRVKNTLPHTFTDSESSRQLSAKLPELATNPAFAPVLSSIKAQILRSNPSATPEMVSSHTLEYLNQFAALISGASPQAAQARNNTVKSIPRPLTHQEVFSPINLRR